MNAGLSNLATLKAWLLAPSLLTSTEYDAQISAIGLGVAAQLEKYCARKFARTEGDTFECSADRSHVTLPRYPVEAITTIEQKDAGGEFAEATGLVEQEALDRGMLYFYGEPGTRLSRLRITYTGGYFFEQLEPSAEGYPTALPEGATAVPDDLALAWKLQCEHLWAQRDKLGVQLAKDQGSTAAIAAAVPLIDTVKEMLRTYVRYSTL